VVDRTYDDDGRLSHQERTAAEASADFLYDGRSFLSRAAGVAPDTTGGIFCDGFETGDTSGWGSGQSTCPATESFTLVEPTYDSAGLLHSVRQPARAVHLLYFAGRPIAQFATASNTLTYLSTDHLDTPILATNEAGGVVWEGGFEPFGDDYAGASEAGVFLRFPGQWDDAAWAESGVGAEVINNLHRWYGTGTGRYTRVDPAATVSTSETSIFAYVSGNPILFFDPLGLFKVDKSCDGCTHPTLGPRFAQSRQNLTSIITREVSAWCQSRLGGIKNVALRQCIEQSCREGEVRCEGTSGRTADCDGASQGFTRWSRGDVLHWSRRNGILPTIRTAFICANNPVNFDSQAGDTVIHEWAHGCGWNADKKPLPEGIPASETAH
ncbi:MAG: RHS repeat-associated core domain-containing protein, partial [Acidobacteriota bacterium]